MAKISTETLKARIAAEKNKQAAAQSEIKSRVASAWTLAKTMLPSAPEAVQFKLAQSLLGNSTRALKVALRQAAVNAHYTRIAEQFENVHKVDLNDLLENPSVLNKEENAVTSELKGEARNASAKKADDRKDAGPLPEKYPEPKRDEPKELDGGHAADRPKELVGEGAAKEASKKKAHGADCKGCENCDKEMKEASAKAKKAEEEKAPEAEEAKEEDAKAEEAAGEADVEAEDANTEATEAIDEADEANADADAATEETEEPFDGEKANLEDAVSDLKNDIDNLEDAIAEFSGDADDMNIPVGDEDTFDENGLAEENPEGEAAPSDMPEGEELNLDDIFNQDNMTDKVSALNDEEHIDVIEVGDGDDFFAPSDPSELESVLEQEEALSSPADMFSVEGVNDDPLAEMFAHTASAEGVVEPGSLESYFSTDLKGDTRDAETDHDGDIMSEVAESLKQPTREDHRDTEAKLEAPKQATIRRLKQTPATPKEATQVNLASLLFGDDSEFV